MEGMFPLARSFSIQMVNTFGLTIRDDRASATFLPSRIKLLCLPQDRRRVPSTAHLLLAA